jgi:hypothetical protein
MSYEAAIPAPGAPYPLVLVLPEGVAYFTYSWGAAYQLASEYSTLVQGLASYAYSVLWYDRATMVFWVEYYGGGISYPRPNNLFVKGQEQPILIFEKWIVKAALLSKPLPSTFEIVGFGTLFGGDVAFDNIACVVKPQR